MSPDHGEGVSSCVGMQVPHCFAEGTLHILGLPCCRVGNLAKNFHSEGPAALRMSPSVRPVFSPSALSQRVFKTGHFCLGVVSGVGWVGLSLGLIMFATRHVAQAELQLLGPSTPVPLPLS